MLTPNSAVVWLAGRVTEAHRGVSRWKPSLIIPAIAKKTLCGFHWIQQGGKNCFVWITVFGFEGELNNRAFWGRFWGVVVGWFVTLGLADDARQFVF